ncbi:signal peptidase I [Streptococcus sp. HF-1907]|uniref:signal peptidase I n=1 Tax=Streptococcus sp. HF-1907 TaxID=2785793 RepID=UPI00189C8997|nr:signal peptidase I [Streptococcus sp. HF-1907]MBF7094443.1 signal peptidase I [Streptococcus sp. HF-1907]
MKNFLKEWGAFLLIMILFFGSRLLLWQPVKVDGHSMDPTLADKERLLVISHTKIDRFDIVVANETENGVKKQIVKRVIGLPGDTISYKDDVLTVNGKTVDEPYLVTYQKLFKKDKLQSTYSYNSLFQELAESSSAFTTDSSGSSSFTVKVPKGQYFLLGDDRIVSRDSREVGTFEKSTIVGEVKFRFWPFNKIGTLK